MDFLLRILFSGLIAFIPSSDGKELTVILLQTHAHTASDGTELPHHEPVLLARAGRCEGKCSARDSAVAHVLFADKPADQGADALEEALLGGGAWLLAGSDLSVRTAAGALEPSLTLVRNARALEDGRPKAIPGSSREREDFSWVPDLDQVLPSLGNLDPALFGARPPKGVVAARLRLRSGRVFTYSLIRAYGKVAPIHFRVLGSETESPVRQAMASWVAAEIRVPGGQVEIVATSFDDGTQRSMKLSPKDGLVEMAILNLPAFQVPPPGMIQPAPQPGKHFEAYYDLAKTRPAADARPIPHFVRTATEIDWMSVHPRESLWSALLEKIRMEPGRGPYDVILCPTVQDSQP